MKPPSIIASDLSHGIFPVVFGVIVGAIFLLALLYAVRQEYRQKNESMKLQFSIAEFWGFVIGTMPWLWLLSSDIAILADGWFFVFPGIVVGVILGKASQLAYGDSRCWRDSVFFISAATFGSVTVMMLSILAAQYTFM